MGRRHGFAIALALAFVASCASRVPSPTTSTAVPSPTANASLASPEPGVEPTIDPAWITRPALTCGDRERLFPPEALGGPGIAHLAPDEPAAVLRSVIADAPPETPFPDSGWHRVVDRPDGVMFVARGDPQTPWWVVTVGVLDGTLQPIQFGQCRLSIAPPSGVTLAQWWLDPDAPPITAESTTLAALAREEACANGEPPDGRVMRPTIVSTTETIMVAISVQTLPSADCPGNPAFPIEIGLPEALGSRVLLDASEFPPRPVTTTDPG